MALRDDHDDVARFFEALVEVLVDAGPDRLRGPIQVSEVYQTILPYRRYRTRLGFDTNQDYETALLRFLAGEGGYVTLHPPEAQDTLAAEAAAVHPDPGLVHEFAGATIRLDRARVERLLTDEPRFAPPARGEGGLKEGEKGEEMVRRVLDALDSAPPAPPAADPPLAARSGSALEEPVCRNCGRSLPLNREVVYCPFCGHLAGTRSCVSCGEPLEEGWRFCARCGAPSPAPPNRPARGP